MNSFDRQIFKLRLAFCKMLNVTSPFEDTNGSKIKKELFNKLTDCKELTEEDMKKLKPQNVSLCEQALFLTLSMLIKEINS